MQAVLPAAFARLGLSDPAALFDAPGLDGAAIRQALDTALDRVPAVPGQPAAFDRQRLLAEAGRILLADPPRLSEAIHLTRSADPALADSAPLAHIRLIALWRLGDRDATLAEADRVLCLPRHSPRERRILRDALVNWGLERLMPVRVEHLADYWPDLPAAIADPHATLTREVDLITANPPMLRLLQALGHGEDAGFRRRFLWGAEWHRRILFTRLLARQIQQDTPPARRSATGQAVIDLVARLDRLFRVPDLSALTAACAAGRSVVVVHAHAGLMTLGNAGLRTQPFPVTTVSQGPNPVSVHRTEDSHLATSAPDAALAFAKLAKAMKKYARIVTLYPDGPYGDQIPIPVLGKPVPIGRGAAFLAWQGKADVVFIGTRWVGRQVEFTLDPGPRAIDHASGAEFEAAFNRFYAGCLERIALGPPEDMVPNGGFWPHLIR